MITIDGIAKNFRFMLVQITKQLDNTAALLDSTDTKYVRSIHAAEEYIDTQKSMIEDECFKYLSRQEIRDPAQVDQVRALNVITGNLERISDFAVNITKQLGHFKNTQALRQRDCSGYVTALRSAVPLISDALFSRDSALAMQICRVEEQLDQRYAADVQDLLKTLRNSREVEDPITTLFILHYLERMGDAMLNIGEAILFSILGERFKLRQYRVLDDALASNPEIKSQLTDADLSSIWGTRSGARVGTVAPPTKDARHSRVLFKEGNPSKLEREKESLQRWGVVAPGLAPEVVEYQNRAGGAALLLQYLDGTTFQDILVNAEPRIVNRALGRIEETVAHIWRSTIATTPTNAEYLQQLAGRLPDVYRMHPELRCERLRIGDLSVPTFAKLLTQATELDEALPAPFTTFIHGDFNLDNIIYNAENDKLHLVDVHRSRDSDYVQDVSVFLVSAFRLPVLTPILRRRLEVASLDFLRFARGFAREHNDATFEARLALGLVRSFVTSTRFEFNRRFARAMHVRAVLLLRELWQHRGRPWVEFAVPDKTFLY